MTHVSFAALPTSCFISVILSLYCVLLKKTRKPSCR